MHPPHAQPVGATPCCLVQPLSQVYLDVKVEGDTIGRIVIDLFDDVKVASQRFADLAEGKEGVGYRLSKFDGIFPVCVSGCGVFVDDTASPQLHMPLLLLIVLPAAEHVPKPRPWPDIQKHLKSKNHQPVTYAWHPGPT